MRETGTTTTTTAELDDVTVARARRGDDAALRSLVEFYAQPVFALLFRMLVGRRSDVEDASQETFVRVIGAIGRFDPKGTAKLSTWILTIATRIAIDRLRRPVFEGSDVVHLVDPRPSPEANAAARSLAARVEAQMASLAPEARAALVLRAYHDLDYDEIAQIQAVEIGTVKSRIARARTALRVALEEIS